MSDNLVLPHVENNMLQLPQPLADGDGVVVRRLHGAEVVDVDHRSADAVNNGALDVESQLRANQIRGEWHAFRVGQDANDHRATNCRFRGDLVELLVHLSSEGGRSDPAQARLDVPLPYLSRLRRNDVDVAQPKTFHGQAVGHGGDLIGDLEEAVEEVLEADVFGRLVGDKIGGDHHAFSSLDILELVVLHGQSLRPLGRHQHLPYLTARVDLKADGSEVRLDVGQVRGLHAHDSRETDLA